MYRENIDAKIAECMKAGKSVELAVWRSIKNEFVSFKTGRDTAGKELTDEIKLKLIKKLADQRRDSADQFKAAGRIDLETNERNELAILEQMLPKEPTEAEVMTSVKTAVDELRAMNGQVSMRDMKAVQAMVRQELPAANGAMIAAMFKKFA